jgi:G3E family GTPase
VCADLLLISKPASAALMRRLQSLNPWAEIAEGTALAPPAVALFAATPTRRRQRLWAAAEHTHGITAYALILHRRMTRMEFAVALGGLARERGEDLLHVKGLIEFADRPAGRPACRAAHALPAALARCLA